MSKNATLTPELTLERTMYRDLEVLHVAPVTPKQDAPPLLFVHGAWHGAWCWEHFLPFFAENGYDAYALSLRAHGNSEGKSPRWAGWSDYVADVAYVAGQLSQTPVIIGHSMGGYVTQKYLETHKAHAAIFLASIPAHGILPFVMRLMRDVPFDMLRAGLTLSPYQLVRSPERALKHFFSESLPQEELLRYYNQLGDESMRILLESSIFALPQPSKVRRRQKNLPTLVLAAERDVIFMPPEERDTAEAYRADYRTFDMAHDMMLEPNWDEVAKHMLRWLADYPVKG
jgi:pimeloyl-ACP methyl ester carboxylesterase